MSRSSRKTLVITMGDPCGVGPEVTAKAVASVNFPRNIVPVIIGNKDSFVQHWPRHRLLPSFTHVTTDARCHHASGRPTASSARDSLLYIDHAINLFRSGILDGLVTGPVSKEAIIPFSRDFSGHTEYLARACRARDVQMLFVVDTLRVALATTHIPLSAVPAAITALRLKSVCTTSAQFIKHKFRIRKPRIAVCGLNPHAGEGGHIGHEERSTIIPAIKKLQQQGWDIRGPFPADTLLEPRNRSGFDLIVSMYHDQVLPALKAEFFNELVNVTAGLPFVRTSPAHGTAFAIAGKGIADHHPMMAAITMAARLM